MDTNDLKAIWDGWYNTVSKETKLSPAVQQLTNERLAICFECPFAQPSAVYGTIKTIIDNVVVKEERTELKEKGMQFKCTLCHCQLYAKASNPSMNCPGNTAPKYGAIFPPKWTNRSDVV